MTAINILHLSSSEVFGGNEEHIRVCAKYADASKFNVCVACPDGDFADRLREQNMERLPLNIKSKFSLFCALEIAKIVKERNIHIVHSHNRRTDFFAYLSHFFSAPSAFVTTVHDRVDAGASGISASFHMYLLRSFFNAVYCVSRATRGQVIKFSRCVPGKVFAVTNGMDLSRFSGVERMNVVEKKKDLGLAEDKPVVGMLARMRDVNFAKKAQPVFLRAAAEVLKIKKDAQFVVAGLSDEPRITLQSLCDELGISHAVRLLGYRKDALETLSCFDVFVLPSSYEGLPRTLADAMLLGKPVVATNVDGIPELVRDGENGLLVPAGDFKKMAEAVLDYLEYPKKAKEFGARAMEFVSENFSHEKMVSQFEFYYGQLLGGEVKRNVAEVPHLLNQ